MANVNADFNQSGNSVFENVYITGLLDYDFNDDDLTINSLTVVNKSVFNDLDIGYLNVTIGSSFAGISTFNDSIDIEDWIFHNNDFTEGVDPINPTTGRKVLDTKFGFPANNAFSIYTNNAERFLINSSGNVGIGTGGLGISAGVGLDNFLTENKLFQVGIGKSDTFVIISNPEGIGFATVGIGTAVPGNPESILEYDNEANGPLKLDIDGSLRISRNIYDSSGSAGQNNYWMRRDERGIRWVPLTPEFKEGIFLQDEGVDVPSAGAAQSFTTINFQQKNSLGLGVDTLLPTAGDTSTIKGSGLATVFTFDLWGHDGAGEDAPIYRMTNVGIGSTFPTTGLDVDVNAKFTGVSTFTDNVFIDEKLDVDGETTLNNTLDVDGQTTLNSTLDVDGATTLNLTLDVDGKTTFNDETDSTSSTSSSSVQIDGGVGIVKKLFVGGITKIENDTDSTDATDGALIVTGGVGIGKSLRMGESLYLLDDKKAYFGDDEDLKLYHTGSHGYLENETGALILNSNQFKVETDSGKKAIQSSVGAGVTLFYIDDTNTKKFETTGVGASVLGSLGITTDLHVGGISTFVGIATFKDEVGIGSTLTLKGHLSDINNDIGAGIAKTDYRLASVGTGVSWRPSGVETENAIWVSVDGIDTNSGLLEGDAKRTIGAAAAIAQEGDTIIVRSGTYFENNPIGLRTDVSVSGEDLRLVTIIPQNRTKDVFHVRRGCLIQNLNFSGPPTDGKGGVSIAHTDAGAVAFPPTAAGIANGIDFQAVTGYTGLGPANEGVSGRWKSPYIRNCTNFMTGSIGMKINGDYAEADFTGTNNLGQDLKSMVCDSFTQYNEAGIGVSITNNAYAQLVSIFTIASEIAIFCGIGGQCDLTNSNSSFGTYGLYADGYGRIEFEGTTKTSIPAEVDVVSVDSVIDDEGNFRKPFDGQGAYFHINLADFDDTTVSGIVTQPLQLVRGINVTFGGNTGEYSAGAPPIVTVNNPLGPEAILPEFSPNVSAAGTITSIDVINSGRNFLPNQAVNVTISGGGSATAIADMDPILFTVERASEPDKDGLSDVTFNEFIPYPIVSGTKVDFVRLSRIITSSHSFEYVGAGTDINRANPFQGGEPVPANEIVAINGGQVPFTSTDQKGNFRIGEGLVIDQTTSTISGRDFNRALQAQITPLILALR